MRHRLGWLVVMTLLAAGCATPRAHIPVADARTDVWFMQHMVPHLRQTAAVVSLTRHQLTDSGLARLATEVLGRSQADIDQLQGWLDQRGCRRTGTATNESTAAAKLTSSGSPSYEAPPSTSASLGS